MGLLQHLEHWSTYKLNGFDRFKLNGRVFTKLLFKFFEQLYQESFLAK